MSARLLCFFAVMAMLMPAVGLAQNGALKVTSFPSGANVSIDGVDTGKVTPMSISLPVGDHTVTVAIADPTWNPDVRPVSIVSGNNDLSVTLLPKLTTGPQGPQGPAGPQGPPGPPGPTAGGLNGVQEFTSSAPFTVPAGITHLLVDMWGGGGQGGQLGAGGGGGGYVRAVVSVVPGATYTIVVGTGGNSLDSLGNGQNGGDTRIVASDGTILLFAGGGGGGSGTAGGCVGGAGGVADPSAPIHRDGNKASSPFTCPLLPGLGGGGSGFGVINPAPGFGGGGSGAGNGPMNPPAPGQPGYVQILW